MILSMSHYITASRTSATHNISSSFALGNNIISPPGLLQLNRTQRVFHSFWVTASEFFGIMQEASSSWQEASSSWQCKKRVLHDKKWVLRDKKRRRVFPNISGVYVAPYSRPVPYSRHPPYSRHFFNDTHENDCVWALFPIAVSGDHSSTQVCKEILSILSISGFFGEAS